MENNKTRIEKPEELLEYCKTADTNVKIDEEGASIIMDIMAGYNEGIYITEDGKLEYTNHGEPEGETVDDLIDYVCGINYVSLGGILSKIRDNAMERSDFVEFCKLKQQEGILEKNMDKLTEMFNQSTYGKDSREFADFLSIKTMKEEMLKPVYDYLYEVAYSYYGDETDRILEQDYEMKQKDPEAWEKEKERIHEKVLKENEEKLRREKEKNHTPEDKDKHRGDDSRDENRKPRRNNRKGRPR